MTLMTSTVETVPVPASAAVRRRLPLRRGMVWALVVGVLLLSFEAYRVVFGSNFHTVIAGQVYRCSQPSGGELDHLIAAHQLRTVINLRGNGDTAPWYLEETRATHRHNVSQEDICFSAGRLPSTSEVRRLIDVLEHSEYPILLHCRRGADRTGLAAAMVMLLNTDAPLQAARWQMNPRFGHVPLGRPGQLDGFLGFYEAWLDGQGQTHSPQTFRHWALCEYRPGSCWCELRLLKPPPAEVRTHAPIAFQVRARNTSLLQWRLNPMQTAGTHLGCHIYDDHDCLIAAVKTGLRDEIVAPGQSVDFTLVLPAFARPGRYRVQIDMIDERQCWFYQTGSEPLELEVIVRE
jgi:protein tyrosine phosphatase (PTP) superfamily phosphohydrolase (DUF442 family)